MCVFKLKISINWNIISLTDVRFYRKIHCSFYTLKDKHCQRKWYTTVPAYHGSVYIRFIHLYLIRQMITNLLTGTLELFTLPLCFSSLLQCPQKWNIYYLLLSYSKSSLKHSSYSSKRAFTFLIISKWLSSLRMFTNICCFLNAHCMIHL